MSLIREIAEIFGIRQTPWVIRVYLILFLVCVGILIGIFGYVPPDGAKEHPATQLFELAKDSFKLVLGAVIGSLSMAAQKQWGSSQQSPAKDEEAG